MSDWAGISAYPVGALSDWKAGRTVGYIACSAWKRAKARNWRALRNYFNGYLAEWHFPPDGLRHSRCGRGWTKRAAIRRLGVLLAHENLRAEKAGGDRG